MTSCLAHCEPPTLTREWQRRRGHNSRGESGVGRGGGDGSLPHPTNFPTPAAGSGGWGIIRSPASRPISDAPAKTLPNMAAEESRPRERTRWRRGEVQLVLAMVVLASDFHARLIN